MDSAPPPCAPGQIRTDITHCRCRDVLGLRPILSWLRLPFRHGGNTIQLFRVGGRSRTAYLAPRDHDSCKRRGSRDSFFSRGRLLLSFWPVLPCVNYTDHRRETGFPLPVSQYRRRDSNPYPPPFEGGASSVGLRRPGDGGRSATAVTNRGPVTGRGTCASCRGPAWQPRRRTGAPTPRHRRSSTRWGR